MPVPRTSDSKAMSPKPAPAQFEGRRPWKKKTPVEVVLEQAEKLKAEIAETEEELKAKRKQLQKFEEAKKSQSYLCGVILIFFLEDVDLEIDDRYDRY